MLTMEDAIKQSSSFCPEADDFTLKLPEGSAEIRKQLEELRKLNCPDQLRLPIFRLRCEQAEELGFPKVTVEEAVKMLMNGVPATNFGNGVGTYTHEYFYNHMLGSISTTWAQPPVDYTRIVKPRWDQAPFSEDVRGKTPSQWTVRFGPISGLNVEIPYAIALKINALKELNLFNCFNVVAPFAPVNLWKETDKEKPPQPVIRNRDPVLMGTIYDLDKDNKIVETQRYFIAKWE